MAIRPRRVLIVEELAHWSNGHFPVRCAQLATAYAELGFSVELLTSEGWARTHEHPNPPFTIRRYRTWARLLKRAAVRSPRRLRTWTLTLLQVVETRARARAMTPAPEAVIVLSWRTDPLLLAAAAGRRRWLVFAFSPPDELPTIPCDLSRVIARHGAAGGGARFAVPSADH